MVTPNLTDCVYRIICSERVNQRSVRAVTGATGPMHEIIPRSAT